MLLVVTVYFRSFNRVEVVFLVVKHHFLPCKFKNRVVSIPTAPNFCAISSTDVSLPTVTSSELRSCFSASALDRSKTLASVYGRARDGAVEYKVPDEQ